MRLNYEVFAKDLVERFDSKITGSALSGNIKAVDKTNIMIGMLGAERMNQKIGNEEEYVENKEKRFESLPSIQLSFLTKAGEGQFKIQAKGDFYYRICPSYHEQLDSSIDEFNKTNNVLLNTIDQVRDYVIEKGLDAVRFKSLDLFNKMVLEYNDLELTINSNDFVDGKTIFKSFSDIIQYKINEIASKSIHYNKGNNYLEMSSLESEESFNNYLSSTVASIKPSWNLALKVKIKKINNVMWKVDVLFFNQTVKLTQIKNGYDENFYNASIKIYGLNEAKFEDIQTGFVKKTYKKQPVTKALSANAEVIFDKENNYIETNCLPLFMQKKIVTNDMYNQNIKFTQLINNPLENLLKIYDGMNADYNNLRALYRDAVRNGDFTVDVIESYRGDLDDYKSEIERFKLGIDCIANNHYASIAFKLMNKAMCVKMHENQKVYSGWRLFQIVFIVSLIPDLLKQEYKDDSMFDRVDLKLVDLLYFSTGGGKTEAFFGIMTFGLFFDRLRGKNIGVSSIIKYPLRLLSVQQLDRCITMIVKANKVLNEEYGQQFSPFTIGYFVGEGNTKNDIKVETYQELIGYTRDDLNEYYRVIEICPYCGNKHIQIYFNKDKWCIEHRCESCQTVLPVYTIDDEIYRFLPSVIISTIDKLAAIGMQRKYKALFGGVTHFCQKHGFSIDNKCNVADNKYSCDLVNIEEELYDPLPSLIIQDELHLVRESLGTFSSHYESLLQYYCNTLVCDRFKKTMKYIGATATISNYEDQLINLYGLNSRRFPCEYPSKEINKNFYSHESESLTRIIQGFTPYGVSVTDSIQVINTIFRKNLFDIVDNLTEEVILWRTKGYETSKEELLQMTLNYWISIVYNNSKREAQDLENLFTNQGNNTLSSLGIPVFNIAKITGDDDFRKVKSILNNVIANEDKRETDNLILATSSISHGVDEDSFNQMYFFGMPNNSAEYIQAYSRVGRKHVGIVFDILRLIRERDRSYLKYFTLFHKNKDFTIEPVPIDRWARNAIYFTLPGIMHAVLLQYYETKIGIALNNKHSVRKAFKEIDINEYINHVKSAYMCGDESNPKSKFYSEIIVNEVRKIVSGIITSNDTSGYVSEFYVKYSSNKTGQMRSLRDYEEGIDISLKNNK